MSASDSSDPLPSIPHIAAFCIGVTYVLAVVLFWSDPAQAAVSAEAAPPRADGARDYTVSPYQRIYLQGDAEVRLTPGGGGAVRAFGSDRALAGLTVESSDGVLYLQAGEQRGRVEVHVAVAELQEVVIRGPGRVSGAGLRAQALILEGQGAGSFDLEALDVEDLVVVGRGKTDFVVSGAVRHQVVELAGVGRYIAPDLHSRTSQVSVRGSGTVDVWADELLDVNILGAAKVNYTGTPWVLQHIFGTGAVTRRDR